MSQTKFTPGQGYKIGRRGFLGLASGISAAGAVSGCLVDGIPDDLLGQPIDYRRAKATPTICFGCTTHCSVIGWVQDGRVRKIDGNPLDPNTQGTVCSKANGMISYTYYPERLLYPIKRVGKRGEGRWRRISWDEALNEIAAKMKALRDAGTPEEFVFHYGRDKTKGFTSRFTNAFGTPNRLNRRSICSSNRRVPLMSFYGREFEWESQDFENSKYILNFGGNPMEAYQGGLYMIRRIMDAKVKGGAKMVTFEVRPTATASVSQEFYSVRPGSDGAIAFAMAYVITQENLANVEFWERWANIPYETIKAHLAEMGYTPEWAEQESGVPAQVIRRLAREFAAAAPHCTTMSNRGSAKHYNGTQNDRAIRMLDVLVGNVGKPGGFCLSTLRMWKNRYGQEGLPVINQPGPSPSKPKPWLPGTREFEALPQAAKERVLRMPESWQKKYFGELATPSEYPLSWRYYNMRVGQLVYPYIKEGSAKVGVYMSYTLGASYGYPEANLAREVLMDEALVPFHVAIDINYSEQAQLADIILPDATSLERWDAHSTNNYGLIPYTGIRQPLVEPLGQARPVQLILQALAQRIGGGMEKHFAFSNLEDYYREWYKEVPIPWEELKRRGVWQPENRPKDYELYERPLSEAELQGSSVDPESQLISKTDAKGKNTVIGIMQNGVAVRGFPTLTRKIQIDEPWMQTAAEIAGHPLDDFNAARLPTWGPVPEFTTMGPEDFHLTTFKWNVHTQGRSSYWKYHAEIVHTNQIFINPFTAQRLGLADGDKVEVTVFRPKGLTYRANESAPVGSFINQVKLLDGVHPKTICCSHHGGHWEHGPIAKAQPPLPVPEGSEGMGEALDRDMRRIWWAKANGGVGNGVAINDALPINPAPLVGGQNWFDNVCRIRKVSQG